MSNRIITKTVDVLVSFCLEEDANIDALLNKLHEAISNLSDEQDVDIIEFQQNLERVDEDFIYVDV